jgi:hypothetical protein
VESRGCGASAAGSERYAGRSSRWAPSGYVGGEFPHWFSAQTRTRFPQRGQHPLKIW